MENNKDILIKAWETVQNISQNNDKTAWNIRMWGISIWSALIAFGFQHCNVSIILYDIFIILLVFIFEVNIRIIQYKMIQKSHNIENMLNQVLCGDSLHISEEGIRTDISKTSFSDIQIILNCQRFSVWGPYIILFIVNLIILFF
ncbi:TPA: hypothetical protein QB431_002100, partial [Pasteurella multocida]|nr:hypothetical protein [Pasteurella multocida]